MPPFLVAGDNVAHLLPDGTELFSNLTFSIAARQRVALVGRNGIGKSSFADLLAEEHAPGRGTIARRSSIALLQQDAVPPLRTRVVDYLGLGETFDALTRSEDGEASAEDIALIADDWCLEEDLRHSFEEVGIGHLAFDHQLTDLSGGEWLRLQLLNAIRIGPDLLILDEPSNHLDRSGRRWLEKYLREASFAWILISHDRHLLSLPDEIWELTPTGFDVYGGNYDHYLAEKTFQQQAATARVAHAKQAERRAQHDQQVARERQERKAAKGRRSRSLGGQPKLVLDSRKARSEQTSSRLSNIKDARLSEAEERVAAAKERVKENVPVRFDAGASSVGARQPILTLQGLSFGYELRELFVGFDLTLKGPVRVHLEGENGSGKSTLLDIIAGHLKPSSGILTCHVPIGYLLQQDTGSCSNTLVQHCRSYRPAWKETDIRTSLARAGIRRGKAVAPLDQLSAGERVRAELVRLLNCPEPAQLLLLDEPSNHLDLDALQALESALQDYRGALLFTSHDPVFVERMNVSDVVALKTR